MWSVLVRWGKFAGALLGWLSSTHRGAVAQITNATETCFFSPLLRLLNEPLLYDSSQRIKINGGTRSRVSNAVHLINPGSTAKWHHLYLRFPLIPLRHGNLSVTRAIWKFLINVLWRQKKVEWITCFVAVFTCVRPKPTLVFKRIDHPESAGTWRFTWILPISLL